MPRLDYSAQEYLPDSQGRIERLRQIIRGRPVAILAAGPSIKELEERIEELCDADICYFGLNNYFVQENNILKKIGKRASVVSCSGREGLPEAMSAIIDFLDRDENNFFISTFWRDAFGLLDKGFNLPEFLSKYDHKLLFFSLAAKGKFPNNGLPLHFIPSNSLLIMIQMAIIGKASKVILFGADGGYTANNQEIYYRHGEYAAKEWQNAQVSLLNDALNYFNPSARAAILNSCNTYGLPLINILNCSENSLYTPFPKLSYNDTFEHLLKGKTKFGKLDLRVPARPEAPNVPLLAVKRAWGFWRKYGWRSLGLLLSRARRSQVGEMNNAG